MGRACFGDCPLWHVALDLQLGLFDVEPSLASKLRMDAFLLPKVKLQPQPALARP